MNHSSMHYFPFSIFTIQEDYIIYTLWKHSDTCAVVLCTSFTPDCPFWLVKNSHDALGLTFDGDVNCLRDEKLRLDEHAADVGPLIHPLLNVAELQSSILIHHLDGHGTVTIRHFPNLLLHIQSCDSHEETIKRITVAAAQQRVGRDPKFVFTPGSWQTHDGLSAEQPRV